MTPGATDALSVLHSTHVPVIGVGETAFSRMALAGLLPDYQIFCGQETSDLPYFRKLVTVTTAQHAGGTLRLLKHSVFTELVSSLERPWVWAYKPTRAIWEQCERLGARVLGNHPEIREIFENKASFFQVGRQLGLPMIPGEQIAVAELSDHEYQRLCMQYGPSIVIQRSDLSKGGGSGTYFIHSLDEFHTVLELLHTNAPTSIVNITKFIVGVSPSILGCVTKYGVLAGVVQTQLLDIPFLSKGTGTSGVFMGHEWGEGEYGQEIQRQAERLVKRLGELMYDKGYRGVFGLDLLVDAKTQQVYPVECNARHTGALPMYSMLQQRAGEVSIDVLHTLEFLGVPYELDIEVAQTTWRRHKQGAHIVLTYPWQEQQMTRVKHFPAGVYRMSAGKPVFVRSGWSFADINHQDEFVYTDGCPLEGALKKVGQRVGKVLFARSILEADHQLGEFGYQAAVGILAGLGIRPH